MTSTKEYILYYKNKLERCKDDEDTVLETIQKLAKPTMTAELLQDTGIDRCLYKLTKKKGPVADSATPLFNKWKLLLSYAMKEKASMKNSSPYDASTSSKSRTKDNNSETISKHTDSSQPNRSSAPDPSPHTSHRNNTERGGKHPPTRKDHLAAGNPPHRSHSRHPPSQKDSEAKPFGPSHHGDSERGPEPHPARKDNLAPGEKKEGFSRRPVQRVREVNSDHSQNQPHPHREALPSEAANSTRDSGSERGSGSRKDYFAPDSTRPDSDHNGVSSSQDNQDIDSLSNPNLNIEPDRLNSSSDELDHGGGAPKRTRTLEPYYIEMREGMFRAVKSYKGSFACSGLQVCEMLVKGSSSYRRERDKYDEQCGNEAAKKSPGEASSDGEKPRNGPTEQSSGKGSSQGNGGAILSSRHDLKRKSSSPYKGSDKRTRPDSTSDHKLKVKKEQQSPSQVPKPLNHVEAHPSNCDRSKNPKIMDSPENAAMQYISSKKERSAIYSGRKSLHEILTLKSSCIQVLKKHLDYLRCPMTVPYSTLQPILETLNPTQLSKIEEHNKHLLPHTNGLWKQHCKRDHRGVGAGRDEKEVSWKEEYLWAYEQQQKRLKNVRASINANVSKAKPDRQAKLTLVDSPHDPVRKRAKAVEVPVVSLKPSHPPPTGPRSASPVVGSKSSPKAGSSAAKAPVTVIVKPKDAKHMVAHKPVKKVVAPLMSKVKKSMGIVYRQK